MAFHRYAKFEVLAAGYADAQGSVPAAVSRVGGNGTAFTKSAHRHEFVYDPRPGYLYVRSRAISSRTNDNFDTFPAHAIESSWATFIGKPVFVNHHNSNHRRNRGVIIDAALHKDAAPDGSADTWVEVLMEVDAIRFPKLAEAVVKGWIDRTSMGTEVALSTCSFCGNQAANPTEYCRHIPAMKGQRIIRTQGTRREAVLVTEICEGLFFFENSLLVETPADPTAFTFGLDTRGLAAEKSTAHLSRTASFDSKIAGLAAVLAEAEPLPDIAAALEALSDFEVIEAVALLSKNAMCSECNPDLKGVTSQLCAPHAYQVKARANVGRSSIDALSSVNGTGSCGGYNCSCPAYDHSRNIGVYPTCKCGHTQNVHSDENGGDVATAPQTTKRGSERKTASSSTGETYTFQAPDGKWWWEYHDEEYGEGPVASGGPFPTSAAAFQASCQQYSPSAVHAFPIGAKSLFGEDLFAYRTPPWEKRASKTALGEQRAPAQVDTMRLDSCPVCGDDDGFDGTRCRVCQFVKPPAMFDDPDVEKAKQVDLRGGDVDATDPNAAGGGEQLQCDNCGKTFPLANEPKAVDTTKPGAGAINADPPVAKKTSPSPVAPVKKKGPATSTTSAFAPDETQQGVQPETGFGEQDDQEPTTDGPLADGSTCPACGVGVLHVAPVAASSADAVTPDAGPKPVQPDDQQQPDPTDATQDPAQQDPARQGDPQQPAQPPVKADPNQPGVKPGQQPPADNPVHPDHGAPVAPDKTKPMDDADDADPKDKDDDGKGKDLPPWLKKKKAASHRAGSQSKETVDMTTNPAQQARNVLIEALRSQQSQIGEQAKEITALRRAVATIAQAAGISGHPHFASLFTAADEVNNPVATNDDQALKPAAKDDPESIGAAPAAANTGVTPAATTDVSNTNVALPTEPLNHLVDVTAPTSGVDAPKGDAAHVYTDVKVSQPSNEPFPDNSGWKQSSTGEDAQVRFMASLRLAGARKAAGLTVGIEDVTAAQQINDDQTLSLSVIQHEINTLAAVASARTAPAQQATAASRSLVPQRAEVPRVMPSLSAAAGIQTIGASTSGVAESQVRDSLI